MTDEDFPDLRKGVRCIYLPCIRCDAAHAHTVRYINGTRPELRYVLECEKCASSQPLTLDQYQQFGLMGDSFAALEAGEMSLEMFDAAIPESVESFLAARGYRLSEAARPKPRSLLREDIESAPAARFSNSPGTGLMFAAPAACLAYLATYILVDYEDVPEFIRRLIEDLFVPSTVDFVFSASVALLAFVVTLLRFVMTQPRSMLITPRGIDIKYTTKRRAYMLEDVEWVATAPCFAYLRFKDKRKVKFDSDISTNAKLSRYFRGL